MKRALKGQGDAQPSASYTYMSLISMALLSFISGRLITITSNLNLEYNVLILFFLRVCSYTLIMEI